MAAYAASISSLMRKAVKVGDVEGVFMFAGQCDLTNYNSTKAEITGITGKFKSMIAVVPEGVSDNGYLVKWNPTSKAFEARYSEGAHTHVENTNATYVQNATTAASTAAAGEEVANDVDVGAFHFVAYGLR